MASLGRRVDELSERNKRQDAHPDQGGGDAPKLRAEFVRTLEAQWDEERQRPDPAFTAELKGQFEKVVPDDKTFGFDILCGKTLCGVTFADVRQDSYKQFVQALLFRREPAWRGSFTTVKTEARGERLAGLVILGRPTKP